MLTSLLSVMLFPFSLVFLLAIPMKTILVGYSYHQAGNLEMFAFSYQLRAVPNDNVFLCGL